MPDLALYLLVFLGSGIGGMLRYGVVVTATRALGLGFPFGTLIVNIVGCLVMGLLAGWFAFRGDATQPWRLFLMTGVLGGFTTFSAFSLDVITLWERGEISLALGYVALSILVSIAALLGGLTLMRVTVA